MEKQKRWQFYLILAVIALTLYNILPTIFFYSQPLKSPIDQGRAENVAQEIVKRVDSLEDSSVSWLESFNKLIGLKAESIKLNPDDPRLIEVSFSKPEESERFKRFLPRSGALIPFFPSQLELSASQPIDANKAIVARQIGVNLDPKELNLLFSYIPKYDEKGAISPSYKTIVNDRVEALAMALGGDSAYATQLIGLDQTDVNDDAVLNVAEQMVDLDRALQKSPALSKRVWSSFSQGTPNTSALIQKFNARLDAAKVKLAAKKETLTAELKKSPDSSKEEQLQTVQRQLQTVEKALLVVKKNETSLKQPHEVLSAQAIQTALSKAKEEKGEIVLSLNGTHPFVEALVIDVPADTVEFKFFDDINAIRNDEAKTEAAAYLKDRLNYLLFNEMARVARLTDENIQPSEDNFAIKLSPLADTKSFLGLNLGHVAQKMGGNLLTQLKNSWQPQHPDLVPSAYPVRTWDAYSKETGGEQKLGLVVYSPSMSSEAAPKGFRKGSIYVIARGMNLIVDKFKSGDNKDLANLLNTDLTNLKNLLTQYGFIGYPGSMYGMDKSFSKDFIFELEDYYSPILKATREDFEVKGSKKIALLPFTDVEQRIITWNKIQDKIQDDLLKWKDEYNAAQVDIDPAAHYTIPKPTENPYWTNFLLSMKKYFRGDDRKILKWGLDLSGGKTVRIGLVDKNNQPVTNPEDLKQAVNELYTRINKMGVSERTIRIENNNVLLEFPGSQALSASDLIQASSMYFNIVNEKFSPSNAAIRTQLNQFLQNVWNEAVVTNRKSPEQINEIAWQHLGGSNSGEARPVSESAKVLIENGLVLADPRADMSTNNFNDVISKIAVLRGQDYAEWQGQTHPLIVVFNNYALEGSSLTNVQAGYDPSEGNHLTFGIKRSYEGANAPQGSPRDDFYTWTSQFAEDRIAGTPKEIYSHGRGWRMAVILNGTVISSPTLRSALRDNASISGRFTQTEANQLAADLKAGSLSFTPKILSEQNVSAELGTEERTKGIVASFTALVLVSIAMIGYYRFAGLVATCAVLFNILIMWGVLQNLDAALTLPGIAGIVLTIGMAVDANVLVFERIREEFAISGRIGSAIQAGYRKAFSAIFDSNITTIMAALILIQFDSGPIKGFAVTLIIGIFSSMFTALFMTRYFFAGWVKNPKNKELTMSQWISGTNFDFLGKAKMAVILSVIVMLVGSFFLIQERKTIFGMDFTGGYSLNVEVEAKPGDPSYRLEAMDALQASGASLTDVQVRQLNLPNQLRISLSQGMDQSGHPFYQKPEHLQEGDFAYEYQKNPRLDWVVKSLEQGGLTISPFEKSQLANNWSVMSGQFSDAMAKNAILGLALALFSILVYITFRFEFKFAVAAVVGLVHDVVITLGILALLYKMGLPVQIDLQVVGAIMTIIGYSLNDTIIVFDRVREDLKILKKLSFYDAVNHALNVTLSRTLMTSGTTLLVLLALVLLGGQSIFAFSLVMTIGVLVGTLSSLFIAAPVLLWIHDREESSVQNASYRRS